mgnify:FL=1
MTNTDDEYADDDKKEDADFHGEEKKTSSSRRGMSKSPSMVKRFFTFTSLSLTPGRGQNDAEENNDNEKNKRKCLFVHGWRSNARVSKEHAKHLNLDTKFQQIHLIKGTKHSNEASDELTEGMFLGPWFSWVDDINNDDIDGKSKEEDLVKALRYVVKFVRKHGPYASAVGFSQGGALVALLSRREVLEKLGVEGDVFLWKSATVVCVASVGLIEVAERALGIRLVNDGERIADDEDVLPSLHIFGLQDERKPQNERLMKLFEAKMPSSKQLVRHCLYFDGGHGVPKSIMSDEGFHAEYDAWLKNALSLSLAVEDGPKKIGNTAVANVLHRAL